MFAHIKHAAIYTQNPKNAIGFYEKILGMKRITTAITETNRGHISDGLIGLAVLARRPGIPAGLDHFGFEVDDVDTARERITQQYPQDDRHQRSRKEFPSHSFAAMTPPARSTIFPNAPTPRSGKATKNPAGSNRANLTMSSSAPMNRRRLPISTKMCSNFSQSKNRLWARRFV